MQHRICEVYTGVIKLFQQKIKIINTAPDHIIMQCKISFITNFLINCEKKRYYYIVNDNEVPRVSGTNVNNHIRNLVLDMYAGKEIDKVNYKTIDTNYLFHAYYVAKRKSVSGMRIENIRKFVESNGGFTYDAATSMFGYCPMGTDFSFLYKRGAVTAAIPSSITNIFLRDA